MPPADAGGTDLTGCPASGFSKITPDIRRRQIELFTKGKCTPIANGAICAICEEWNEWNEWNDLHGLHEMRDLRGPIVEHLPEFVLTCACENIYPTMDIDVYNQIRSGGTGFIEMPRGLVAVWGKEAVQFLDGLITNDMKTLEDGGQMLAAFPNAQGRLLAIVRVLRQGDRFLFETAEETREKVFNNLFRFTYAGDFFVEDLSGEYGYFEIFGGVPHADEPSLTVRLLTPESVPPALTGGVTDQSVPPALAGGVADKSVPPASAGGMMFTSRSTSGYFVPVDSVDSFRDDLLEHGAVNIPDDLYETLRIENGIPLYGVDMDENTIVPELGLDGLISYNKGCYIGQEIIARIHFRGHVAKQLTGLILSEPGAIATGSDLTSPDSKNAGRVTSVTYSPKFDKTIALAFVRYDYLAEGTELLSESGPVTVSTIPFLGRCRTMKRRILSVILVWVICVFSIAAQNVQPSEEKAFVSNAYGVFSVERVRSMFDTFFAELSKRQGSKGIVVINGTLKELAERKQVMANHVRFRKFNPAQVEYRLVGGTMEPQTDLWIVPAGAEPPKIDVKAYIAFEFGRTNKNNLERIMREFYNALLTDENSQGYIINYGTEKQIVQREKLIADSLRSRRFDGPRIVMVSGGASDNGVRTVMWIVPEGAEPPKL